ncbi:replication initiator [Nonomuraea turcica]
MTDRSLPRAVRMAMPMARDVVEEVAKLHGVCIRPVPLRRLDTVTGKSEIIDVPCGSTLESKCPPCAKRNRQLRMAQCREGWHLDEEPTITPDEANEEQRWLVEFRADMQAKRDAAEKASDDTTELDAIITGLDEEITAAGMRGSVLGRTTPKRSRSTRRRQDVPDLPKRKMANTTLGRTFQAADGKTYRPSLFVTLTLPSYGKVRDGVPVDPDAYDYQRAARDALHFSKLVDRFVQNLRRVAGYDVQYFASVEPQKRLAPHLHMAIRGTLPRAEIKQIAAATGQQGAL